MKIATVIGTRPQVIKSALLSEKLRREHKHITIDTGQHYDENMSGVFYRELGIPEPEYNLHVGSGLFAGQTGYMLAGIEKVLALEKPDLVLVYGDTNSTLAGAIAAAYRNIPVGHIEAGLRSYDRSMPEEVNRVVTDHLATYLYAPTTGAVANLKREGILANVVLTGDVLADTLRYYQNVANEKSNILQHLGLPTRFYRVLTIHRQANTDNKDALQNILGAMASSTFPVIFPVHPRTRKSINQYHIKVPKNVRMVDPLGYLDMISLMSNAYQILTDSGGIQKEAYILGVPCITLRNTTEWPETLARGWNRLAGTDTDMIYTEMNLKIPQQPQPDIFSSGACAAIAEYISGIKP